MTSIIPSVVADAEFQLATAVSIGSTSFSLASATDDDGVALPSAVYCFTIDNGSSNKEYLQGLLNGVNVTAVKSISRQTAQTTGAVRAHRVGSPCIISDFSTIAQVAKVMNGLGALDGASPLIYDVEPTISDRKQIATLGKVLDLVTGGTVTFDNQTLSGVLAGETIVAGNSVYLKESDQRWWLTDADTVATVDNVRLGIALGSGSAGVAITGGVLLEGAYTTTGLTAGARYYLGNTAGALSATVGTNPMVVGLALSTTRLLFSPSRFSIPAFNEKAALAGGSTFGTPSGSNKFITQDYNASATGIPTIQTFTSSGTWTKPAGLKYVVVEVQAGGGGGGSATDSAGNLGSGGGGGGYSRKRIAAATLGATETVTVGAGGAAGNPAATGGSSSFGSHATATGGTGGASVTFGGSGGSGSSGDVNITGSDGVSVSSSNNRPLGDGGNSFFGGSILGRDAGSSGSNPGYNGKLYGGGGGGSGRNQTGGTGGAGIVIVTEYYS